MKTKYDYKNLENKWYKCWDENKYFLPSPKYKKKYCITIPPPNVTGSLHMGHAFQCTLIDILIRFYRMNKYSTLWKIGTDHAGIATQILIEKLINKKNKKKNITRNYLIKTALKWKKKYENNIITQLKTLGCSANWETKRFTMDNDFSNAVKKAFIDLYNENLIYKDKKIIHWDIKLKTAISDLEVKYIKEKVKLYYIKYKILEEKNEFIIIATTRPETIFGDTAIAVNKTDKRFFHLKNKFAINPITNEIIPIIFDDSIDISFGTGCVKISPGHDINDFEIGKKHNLKIKNIYTNNIKIKKSEKIPEKYFNLLPYEAKKLIIKDLEQLHLIVKIDEYISNIPIGDRSNSIIEPIIKTQWFIKTKPLAQKVIKIIKEKKIKITPQKWEKIFFSWLYNIKDWCISRQIWWGHRIPVWYDSHNNIYVGNDENEIKKKYNLENIKIKQDEDVLDTWFSSALWPFASLGWPKKTDEFKKFYPTNTLITGFDIIFFWVIRMIMMGIKFTKNIPFKEIYIHGLIRDQDGTKMSKTKGNVIDPIDLIKGITYNDLIKKRTSNLIKNDDKEKIIIKTKKIFPKGISSYGVDALRLTFCSLATDNMAIKLDLKKIENYKNFCNKLWNASIFVDLITKNNKYNTNQDSHICNKWIISIWEKNKKDIITAIKKRHFSLLIKILYEFIWNEFCNWYIEFSKELIKTNTNETKNTIKNILIDIIKCLHPITPYITEEIWEKINKNSTKHLIVENYPKYNKKLLNKKSEKTITFIKSIILSLRKIKSEFNIEKETKLSIKIYNISELKKNIIDKNIILIKNMSKMKNIDFIFNSKNIILKDNYIDKIENIKIYININDNKKISEKLITIKNNIVFLEKNIKILEKLFNNKMFKKNAPKNIIKKNEQKLNHLIKLNKKLITDICIIKQIIL